MKFSLLSQIRAISIVIYVLVLLLTLGSLRYVYRLHLNLEEQQIMVQHYDKGVQKVRSFIDEVQELQSHLSFSLKQHHFSSDSIYADKLTAISGYIDSLRPYGMGEESQQTLFLLDTLLQEKREVIFLLSQTLQRKDLLSNIHDYVNRYNPKQLERLSSSITKTFQQRDSVIVRPSEPKGFLERLSNLFRGDSKKDTILVQNHISVNKEESTTEPSKSAHAINDSLKKVMNIFIKQATTGYISQLRSIEEQVNELTQADIYISSQISNLLMGYYLKMIDWRMQEIYRYEILIQKYGKFIVLGGVLVLIVVSVSLIFVVRSIHNVQRHRKALEEANKRIMQVMDSRHRLLLSISHDIKTPINSVAESIEMLLRQKAINNNQANPLLSSCNLILSLVNNLLGFSSIQQEKVTLQNAPFSPYQECKRIINIFEPLCHKKRLTFKHHINIHPEVIIDSDRLKINQIIINILSNAIKYTEHGSISFSVDIQQEHLRVIISDTGVGIETEKLNSIFEPFVRVQENESMSEGMGIGLYVVKGLIDLFNGNIEVSSQPNKGTTFRIFIPIEVVALGKEQSEQKSKRIILVDDDTTFLHTISTSIKGQGHAVFTCSCLSDLKTLLSKNNTVDVIITDMEMGSFSGVDVLDIASKYQASTPVVLMTARDDIQPQKVKAMGFAACLIKPISTSTILSLLENTDNSSKITAVYNEASIPFSSLNKLLNNDKEAIINILQSFVKQGEEEVKLLCVESKEDDFMAVKKRCHKWLSSLLQIAPDNAICDLLKKIDKYPLSSSPYSNWQQDIPLIEQMAKALFKEIRLYIEKEHNNKL